MSKTIFSFIRFCLKHISKFVPNFMHAVYYYVIVDVVTIDIIRWLWFVWMHSMHNTCTYLHIYTAVIHPISVKLNTCHSETLQNISKCKPWFLRSGSTVQNTIMLDLTYLIINLTILNFKYFSNCYAFRLHLLHFQLCVTPIQSSLFQSCPRVTFLGPDPTRRNFDPTRPEIADPTRAPTRPYM